MKNAYSRLACILIGIVLLAYRLEHTELRTGEPVVETTWDALGYYMYLPAVFIYGDLTQLHWLPQIDARYHVTGGQLYQANRCKNGNYAGKYLGGVAILQMPFFLIGHLVARSGGYATDGFSAPYQYAVLFGAVLYGIAAIFLLRKVLRRYFSDAATAWALLLMTLATNLIQYVSVDSAMSHAFIFPLYALVLHASIKWHEQPRRAWAFLTGYLIGLATICRPTEAIMLFIPLLWNTHTPEAARQKWAQTRRHAGHVALALAGGVAGILPQLIYWKTVTGAWVYDVGSKWNFLNPYFRVLFGWENGWLVYTPVTAFFLLGLFFIRRYPFRKSVLSFCLLNIWIVIAWADWRYGATYSTRALVQSYPVFALPFAAVLERILASKWRYAFYPLAAYLVFVNLFQLDQYDKTILHFRDMNMRYYRSIYLNRRPGPLDMSLLDTDEILRDESRYSRRKVAGRDSEFSVAFPADSAGLLCSGTLPPDAGGLDWLKIEATISAQNGYYDAHLNCTLQSGPAAKTRRVRLANPISADRKANRYAFFVRIPLSADTTGFRVYLSAGSDFSGSVSGLDVSFWEPL